MNWLTLLQPVIPLRTRIIHLGAPTFIVIDKAGCNCSTCTIVGMAASAARCELPPVIGYEDEAAKGKIGLFVGVTVQTCLVRRAFYSAEGLQRFERAFDR